MPDSSALPIAEDGSSTALATAPSRAGTVNGSGLSVRDVHASYGQMKVLHGVNIEVGHREIVGLLGHNGSGKSTLLRVLAGLHRRATYQAILEGEDLAHLAPHVIARKGLALVRGAEVFESVTVEEHLRLGGRLAKLGKRSPMDVEQVYELMPVLGQLRKKLGPALSGGQRQLLALAVAFMANPRCMILDEPTTGLDVAARDGLANVLRGVAAHGVPLLLVEQNPTWLADVSERAYLIELGHIIAEGDPISLLGVGESARDRTD